MATALELTRDEWEPYIQAALQRAAPASPGPEAQKQREALLQRVRQAAAQLKQQFGVSRVVLFGSLAHAAWFEPDSDVDLAVEGLEDADFWEAWRVAEELVQVRPVDLVVYEMASESLKGTIDHRGIEL